MTRDNTALNLREGLAKVPEGSIPDPNAPSADELWAAAHGELDPRTAQEVIDRAIADPVAWEEFRLMLAFEQELSALEAEPAANDDPSDESGRRHVRGWIAVGVGLAAALVAVISLQQGLRSGPMPVDDSATYRADDGEGLRSLVDADAALPRDAFELRWEPGPKSARYELQVSTAEPRLLLNKRGLTEARFVVPASALTSVPSGGSVLWRVEEIREDGRRRSATFVTTVE